MNQKDKIHSKIALTQGQIFQANFMDKYLPKCELQKPSNNQKEQVIDITKDKISEIIEHKTFISQKSLTNQVQTKTDSSFIKYTSKNNPESTKIVKISEVPEDPFAPPQFKTKRIPQGPGSPPKVILRSPPRKITEEDQKGWKIPPCTSNYKNKKGFIIPLEMRLAADGRSSIKPTISENFSKFTSALYAQEKVVRKEQEEKEKLKNQLVLEGLKKTEEEIREKAQLARQKRDQFFQDANQSSRIDSQFDARTEQLLEKDEEIKEAELKRNQIRKMIKNDTIRNTRMENVGFNKKNEIKNKERDISERIALGEEIEKNQGFEFTVDHRLLNRDGGLGSGFVDDERENIYDKPLFKEQEKVNIYAMHKDNEEYDDDRYLDSVLGKRNQKGKDNEKKQMNFGPIQFEKDDAEKKIKKN